jgi:CBS domain containing-hemolysin-like protein
VQSSDSAAAASEGRTRSEIINDKIYACGWVSLAVLIERWTRFFHVLVYSNQVNRTVLHLAVACLGTNVVLFLYLTVYLPKVIKLTDPSAWQIYCPKVIPSTILFGVLAALFLIRATFPVWGFLSPLILGIETMGALFSTQLIPWC